LGKIIHGALANGIISEGGGHAAAAGFTLHAQNADVFAKYLEDSVNEQLGGVMPAGEILVDAELDAGGANMALVKKLSALEPFGQANPEPMLVLHGGTLRYASTMGNGSHLRGAVMTSNGSMLNFVGFNLASTPIGNFLLDDSNTNTKIKLLGRLKENEYNGRVSVQFVLEDMAL
jgi:single-stranded-DNA-specific exonuclease